MFKKRKNRVISIFICLKPFPIEVVAQNLHSEYTHQDTDAY